MRGRSLISGSYKMCQACETKPVYEFTNQRKLCRRCFINWFQKKFLYAVRKFEMIERGDGIKLEKGDDFRSVVLKEVLKILEEKGVVEVVKLPARSLQINGSEPEQVQGSSLKKFIKRITNSSAEKSDKVDFGASDKRAKRDSIKIAIPTTIDSSAYLIVNRLIKSDVKEVNPVSKNVIKPLCLFLDEEVLLYAKLKGLKFVKVKKQTSEIIDFVDELEEKHPEVKRAVVNGMISLNNKY